MIANPCQAVCEPLLRVGEVAKLLGVHPSTLLRLATSGRLPGVKIGKLWRFRGSDLDAWVASGSAAERKRAG